MAGMSSWWQSWLCGISHSCAELVRRKYRKEHCHVVDKMPNTKSEKLRGSFGLDGWIGCICTNDMVRCAMTCKDSCTFPYRRIRYAWRYFVNSTIAYFGVSNRLAARPTVLVWRLDQLQSHYFICGLFLIPPTQACCVASYSLLLAIIAFPYCPLTFSN